MRFPVLSLIATALIPSLSASAWAATGGADRGGGNSIVCFKSSETVAKIAKRPGAYQGLVTNEDVSQITSVISYDISSLNSVYPSKAGESAEDYINRLVARYRPWFPELAQLVMEQTAKFSGELIDYRKGPLYRVMDENDVGPRQAPNCVIATTATQEPLGSSIQITFDDRIFNHPKNSLESRHALFLHEVLYRYFRKTFKDQSSKRTRALVMILMKAEQRSMVSLRKQLATIFEEGVYGSGIESRRYASSAPEILTYKVAKEFRSALDSTKLGILDSGLVSLIQQKHAALSGSYFSEELQDSLNGRTPNLESLESIKRNVRYYHESNLQAMTDASELKGLKECGQLLNQLFDQGLMRLNAKYQELLNQAIESALKTSSFPDDTKAGVRAAIKKSAETQKVSWDEENRKINIGVDRDDLFEAVKDLPYTVR